MRVSHVHLVALLLLGGLTAEAATNRYVNCQAAPGGTGTQMNPWNTLAAAVAGSGSGDVIRVSGGPCAISNLSLGTLSGPGPDCRTSDAACTIFRGDPGTVDIIRVGGGTDGFIFGTGATNMKLENFRFVVGGSGPFDQPVKIFNGGTNRIVLRNLQIRPGHAQGVDIEGGATGAAERILVERVHVQGTTGAGFRILSNAAGTHDVTFRDSSAVDTGAQGFAIVAPATNVYNIVFERTAAGLNEGVGYELNGDATNVQSEWTRLVDSEACFNATGVNAWHSAVIENTYVADNAQLGIRIGSLAGDTTSATVAVVATTLADNAGGNGAATASQVLIDRALVAAKVYDMLATSEAKIALRYVKTTGSTYQWDWDLLRRNTGTPVVQYVASGMTFDCNATQVPQMNGCDGSHTNTRTGAPTFLADERHLASGTVGSNQGLKPTAIGALSGITFLRAAGFDQDAHARPAANGDYDIGAYEGVHPICPGDCNRDGTVTIDEITRGILIAEGNASPGECRALDRNCDFVVGIAELTAAVSAAENGCP